MRSAQWSKLGISAAPIVVGALGVAFDASNSWSHHLLAALCFIPTVSFWFWSIWVDHRETARQEAAIERLENERDRAINDKKRQHQSEIEAVLESHLGYLIRACIGSDGVLESYPPDHVAWRIDCGHRARSDPADSYWLTIRGADSAHLPGPGHQQIDRERAVPSLIEEVLTGTGAAERKQLDVRFFVHLWPDLQPHFSNITLCAEMSFPGQLEWMDRVVVESLIVERLQSDRLVNVLTQLMAEKIIQGEWDRKISMANAT